MEKEYLNGLMERFILDFIKMMLNMDLVLFFGLMEGSILGFGWKESNMEWVFRLLRMEVKNMGSGIRGKELNFLI
jgi:hypothetical protein